MPRRSVLVALALAGLVALIWLALRQIDHTVDLSPLEDTTPSAAVLQGPVKEESLPSTDAVPIRTVPALQVRVVDQAGRALEGAEAFVCEALPRTLNPANGFAKSSAQGEMLVPLEFLQPSESWLVVTRSGYRSTSVGLVSTLREGQIVVLETLPHVRVFVHEREQPIEGALVAVSIRTLGEDELLDTAQPGVLAPIATGRTSRDGTVELPAADSGRMFCWVSKPGYVPIEGCPQTIDALVQGNAPRVELRRVHGCIGRVVEDQVLAFRWNVPEFLEVMPAYAPHMHDLAATIRKHAPSVFTMLGVPRRDDLRDGREVRIPVELVTSRRGIVSTSMRVRDLSLGMVPEEVDLSHVPEKGGSTIRFVALDPKGRAIVGTAAPGLKLLLPDEGAGDRRGGFQILVDFVAPMRLPVGTYRIGDSFHRVLGRCVEDASSTIEVRAGEDRTHEVRLRFAPAPVRIQVHDGEGVRVRGATVKLKRLDEVEPASADQSLSHTLPDLWHATLWLPPGKWQLDVRPFDRKGVVAPRTFVVPDEPAAVAIVVR